MFRFDGDLSATTTIKQLNYLIERQYAVDLI